MTPGGFCKKLFGPTLFVVVGVALLTGLGSWQLKRLSWKEALLKTVETRLQKPRLSLEDFLARHGGTQHEAYRRLTLRGHYLHDQEAHLLGRTHGGQVVYHIVTPFLLESGTMVLVDRGWVPAPISATDPALVRPQDLIEERGYLRLKSSRNIFTPENVYEKRELYAIDPQEYAREKSLTTLLPFYVVREGGESGAYPRAPRKVLPDMRNNHLQYSITWYSLALILIVMYILFLRSRRRSPS